MAQSRHANFVTNLAGLDLSAIAVAEGDDAPTASSSRGGVRPAAAAPAAAPALRGTSRISPHLTDAQRRIAESDHLMTASEGIGAINGAPLPASVQRRLDGRVTDSRVSMVPPDDMVSRVAQMGAMPPPTLRAGDPANAAAGGIRMPAATGTRAVGGVRTAAGGTRAAAGAPARQPRLTPEEQKEQAAKKTRNCALIRRYSRLIQRHKLRIPVPTDLERMSPEDVELRLSILQGELDQETVDAGFGRAIFNKAMMMVGQGLSMTGVPIKPHPKTKQKRLEDWIQCEDAPDVDVRQTMTLLVDRIYAENVGEMNEYMQLAVMIAMGVANAVDFDEMARGSNAPAVANSAQAAKIPEAHVTRLRELQSARVSAQQPA